MSSQTANLSKPGFISTDRFFESRTVDPRDINERKRADKNYVDFTIKSISIKSLDELYVYYSYEHSRKTRFLRSLKHMNVAVIGLTLSLGAALIAVSLSRVWLAFFTAPLILGFIEMIITISIAQIDKNNE